MYRCSLKHSLIITRIYLNRVVLSFLKYNAMVYSSQIIQFSVLLVMEEARYLEGPGHIYFE